ncbi:hypothetical protein F5146DRAFT_533014 [Armillaria mellea]|nr:hypothetical protein F5146DRAFT_533014 [Armillaria mellea]
MNLTIPFPLMYSFPVSLLIALSSDVWKPGSGSQRPQHKHIEIIPILFYLTKICERAKVDLEYVSELVKQRAGMEYWLGSCVT